MNDPNQRSDNGKNKFDWVKERSSCSLPSIFKELRLQIEEDVKTRNAIRPNYAPYEFSLSDNEGGGFAVLLQAKDLRMAVTFSLADHAIVVSDDKGKQMFEVTLAFNDEGKCTLTVNGEGREFWQVRRMALEELMFPRLLV